MRPTRAVHSGGGFSGGHHEGHSEVHSLPFQTSGVVPFHTGGKLHSSQVRGGGLGGEKGGGDGGGGDGESELTMPPRTTLHDGSMSRKVLVMSKVPHGAQGANFSLSEALGTTAPAGAGS